MNVDVKYIPRFRYMKEERDHHPNNCAGRCVCIEKKYNLYPNIILKINSLNVCDPAKGVPIIVVGSETRFYYALAEWMETEKEPENIRIENIDKYNERLVWKTDSGKFSTSFFSKL